jgi:hypothetical protein
MSEPTVGAPSSGGNFLTKKFAGIPGWVILAGVGVLAYLYFTHSSKSSTAAGSPKTTGGGGTSTSGKTVVKKGAVTINVKQSPQDDNDQPSPTPPKKKGGSSGHIGAGRAPAKPGLHSYTSNGQESLNEVAKQHNTTAAKIAATTKQEKNNIGKSLGKYLDTPSDYGKPIPKGDIIVYEDGSGN